MKIAIIANSGWYLFNFRRNLMQALAAVGHEPVAISPVDEYSERLKGLGFVHCPVNLNASSTNPLRELATLIDLRRVLAKQKIKVACTFTPKPNIYTGLAARGLGLVHVPNISGLGRVFIRPSLLTLLVRLLYRLSFAGTDTVIFQNEEDRETFVSQRLVDVRRTLRVPGSGVDLIRFSPKGNDAPGEPVVFLLVARMLWDKGVGEFVSAARALRPDYPHVRFELLGSARSDNPAAIPLETLHQWQGEGLVVHINHVDDVRSHLARAHCVVLPSYREGVPRSLLEAAAMSRPLIATDVPGCRDVVDDGVNGFLCEAANAASLEAAMRRFLALSSVERSAMGFRGREKVERQFDERIVLSVYLDLVARRANSYFAAPAK